MKWRQEILTCIKIYIYNSESDEDEKYHASKPSMRKVREILKGSIKPPTKAAVTPPPGKGGKSGKGNNV
jgi:hypothetical protein